jgi:hypothetical protein
VRAGCSGGTFGYLEPVQFQRTFQRNLLGDRKNLPRGVMIGGTKQDKEMSYCIHLSSKEHQAILLEDKRIEKEEYQKKIVVYSDQLCFRIPVSHGQNRYKSLQVDRCSDILDGKPNTLALKMLINGKKSSTGKIVKFSPVPLNMLSDCLYTDIKSESFLRKSDTEKFITSLDLKAKGIDGKACDFIR